MDAKTEEYLEHIFSVCEAANNLPSKSRPAFGLVALAEKSGDHQSYYNLS